MFLIILFLAENEIESTVMDAGAPSKKIPKTEKIISEGPKKAKIAKLDGEASKKSQKMNGEAKKEVAGEKKVGSQLQKKKNIRNKKNFGKNNRMEKNKCKNLKKMFGKKESGH